MEELKILPGITQVLYGRDPTALEMLGRRDTQIYQDALARIAQLTEERDAARRIIQDGILSCTLSGAAIRAWVRHASAWLHPQQEGQGDASPSTEP